jgi:outer membrane protein assembly factor BamB
MSTVDLPGVFPIPESVAWSGDGSVAILYSRTDNWIQTIRGLPHAAEAGASWKVSLGGSLSAVAIDFNGRHAVIGVAGETSGVFQIGDDLSFVPLLSLSKPVALAFSEDGSTLYALDGATGELSELNMANLTTQAWTLDGLEDAFIVKPARDATHRQVIYAAGTSGRLLVAYDASSHEVIAQVPLSSQPTAIESLGQDSYILGPRSSGDQPLWSFTDAPQPVLYFVPAAPLGPEDSGK